MLGVAAILAVLGQSYPVAAALLIVFSLGLFGLANLPIALTWRVALIAVFAAAMGALQLGLIKTGWGAIVVPLLASMFMFRLVLYLYDVRNGRGPKNWWTRLSYFFLPPNPMFPFFPVVDYAAFGRTYYNAPPLEIYQRGVHWIVRGIIHLLIYRIVYLYFTVSPGSVSSPGEFLHYIVANFALYLRISGLFHLIVGLLLLFGFNLHDTFELLFLDELYRLLAAHKYLLERLHAEDRLQPCVCAVEEARRAPLAKRARRHGDRVPDDVGVARLSMVLDARIRAVHLARLSVLGIARRLSHRANVFAGDSAQAGAARRLQPDPGPRPVGVAHDLHLSDDLRPMGVLEQSFAFRVGGIA